MTELQRQQQIEVSTTVQAYLGFMRSGMLTAASSQPSVTVSRAQTIEAFSRMHPNHRGSLALLAQQYVGAAAVVVRRDWWRLVTR